MDGIELTCWIVVGALVALMITVAFSKDTRYDDCEKKYPLTSEYRACVRKFQNEDADAALATSTVLMATTATMQ